MKPQDLTNEQLAAELLEPLPHAWAVKEAARRLAVPKSTIMEKRHSDAKMAYDYANLLMPEDIRSRAKEWGMEAFCEVLWNVGFQSGYREAMRDGTNINKELNKCK